MDEVRSYQYNPDFDIKPVNPMAFIDMHSAYENHNVPTNVMDDIASYNQIEDPDSIVGTPRDIFEAYRMRDHLVSVQRELADKKDVSPSKGEN